MKRLLITLEYPPQIGGVANYLNDLVEQYPKGEMSVLAPLNIRASQEIIEEAISKRKSVIYRRKFFSRLIWPHWLPLLLAAKKIVRQEKIEAIEVGQVLPIGTVALYLKKKFKIPFRLYTYGMDVTFAQKTERKNKLFKKIIAEAQEIITISEYTKKELLKAGAHENKIKIIEPQAHITPASFEVSDDDLKRFMEKYNLINKKIILTVGRLVKRKGQDMVIQALPMVLEKIPNAIYLIVGQGEDRPRLEKLVKDNNLDNQVIFTGKLTDLELAMAYTICHAFIMASREENGDFEGYGIVYKEAQSFNKPVIAGRSGGAVEAIRDNGKIVEPTDIKEISDALIGFLR